MKRAPDTFWYCTTCTRQLAATGIREPAEDLAFQRFLLTGKLADATLRDYFTALASHYRYKRVEDKSGTHRE